MYENTLGNLLSLKKIKIYSSIITKIIGSLIFIEVIFNLKDEAFKNLHIAKELNYYWTNFFNNFENISTTK